MTNLYKAIIEVMKEVSNIEKNSTVGSAGYSYKAVSDSDVRSEIKQSMIKNGLAILPIGVSGKTKIDRWEESGKWKQSAFTEVETKYLLVHTSGESTELAGYGHGVDVQDKASGKATTYALKNTLLDTFLVIKGEDMDLDKTHSNDLPIPKKSTSSKTETVQPVSDGKGHLETNDDPLLNYSNNEDDI